MAYQIGLFCMPQLADAECPKADQIGGYTFDGVSLGVAERDCFPRCTQHPGA
jgi:hypothetical protein